MGDDDIRAALHRGDTEAAFRLVCRAHGKAVHTICVGILRDRSAAEDMMQQTLMAAFKSRGQLLEVDQLRGWLIQTAKRKCLDALRSAKRTDRLHDDRPDADIADATDLRAQLAQSQERSALEDCLAALEPEVRAAVLMRHRDERSWEEIAEAVALPLDTIRMRVNRGAIKRLRDCLESKGITP